MTMQNSLLKDLIVRSQPRFGDEERWPRQNKSGISQLSNAWVQSRNGIKAENGYGPNSENTIPSASSHIYEIICCDRTNKDSQEEKLGGGKSLVTQAAIDEMLRRGAAYMQI